MFTGSGIALCAQLVSRAAPAPPEIQNIASTKVCLYVSNFMQVGERIDYRRLESFEAMQTASWSGEMKQLTEDITDYKRRNYRILLCAGSEKTLPIIQQDLQELT